MFDEAESGASRVAFDFDNIMVSLRLDLKAEQVARLGHFLEKKLEVYL